MMPYLLHHGFLNQAGRHPAAVAVRSGDENWSYGELHAAGTGVAQTLLNWGLQPGDCVAIWMRKSPQALAALLGTLLAGGIYVPLDPAAPPLRAMALAHDCGARFLLTDRERGHSRSALHPGQVDVPGWCGVVVWGGAFATPPGVPCTAGEQAQQSTGFRPVTSPTSTDLAYILYTSGSTGRPKGVMLTHRHALNFIGWAGAEMELGPGMRVANHAPWHFDLSIFDLWATLSRGATVCLLNPTTARFPTAVASWIATEQIEVWYSVPSALVQMLPAVEGRSWPGRESLRRVLFAGEIFSPPQLARWRTLLPGAQFYNLYGPTETNVCTFYRLPLPPEPLPDPLPIGDACPDFEVMVGDDAGTPVTGGAEGFLWVRGPGVMAGYWNDAGRQGSAWQHRPGPGGLISDWYNTGDRVTRDPAGRLLYHGRRDDLVKCRGYRISLLEVRGGLEGCPGVREAVVLAPQDAAGGRHLCAWLVLDPHADGPQPTLADVQRQFLQRLPHYMWPHQVALCDQLPRTSTGKVDRARLLAAGALQAG